jgi:hypothetical protein
MNRRRLWRACLTIVACVLAGILFGVIIGACVAMVP